MKELIGINNRNGVLRSEPITLMTKNKPTIEVKIVSSFNDKFTNGEKVLLGETVNGDYHNYVVIGNINDTYKDLIEELKKCDFHSPFDEMIKTIYKVVDTYFEISLTDTKKEEPKEHDIRLGHDDVRTVASLKHTNGESAIERAMLVQNLLCSLEIPSYYKAATVKINGNNMDYAYNIISNHGSYYIFDTSMPNYQDGELVPIMTEISEEVYNEMIKPIEKDGYAVKTTITDKKGNISEIIYDSANEKVIDLTKKNTKSM